MRDYIFNRIQLSNRIISDCISMAKHTQAYSLDYGKVIEKVSACLDLPSIPKKYKEQQRAILWFTWKREISNLLIFPTIFKGKLYNGKWDSLPKELRQAKRESRFGMDYVTMHKHHFTEGMTVPANAPIHSQNR